MKLCNLLSGVSLGVLTLAVATSPAGAQEALPTIEVGAAKPVSGGGAGNGEGGPGGAGGGAGDEKGYGGAGVAQDPYNESYVLQNASTGTKTDTPVMETPLNVQSVSQRVLQDQQATTLSQALQNVSGVFVANSVQDGSPQGLVSNGIILRGFETTNYYRDGFRVDATTTIANNAQLQFANIANVEVLKGPGAILYGFSDPGGVVNIVTKQPLDQPYYAVQQQVGSLAFYRTSVDATGPLNADKSLLYRVNMSYENNGAPYGSIIDHTGSQTIFVAPVVKWNIDASNWVKLEAEYGQQRQRSLYFPYDIVVNGVPVNIPRNVNYGTAQPYTTSNLFTALTWSHQFDKDWSIKQQIAFNNSTTGYDSSSGNFPNNLITTPASVPTVPLPAVQGVTGASRWAYSTYSTDVDITGHVNTFGAEHTLLLGGDYYKSSGYFKSFDAGSGTVSLLNPNFSASIINCSYTPTPTFNCSPYQILNTQTTAGLYLQDQVKLPHDFFLMAGARYQYIDQGGSFGAGPNDLNPQLTLTGQALSPRFGLLWRPKDWLSLYGNYAEGFGPQFNGPLIWPGILAAPTSAKSWETGAKLEFFDGKLRISADYFELVKTNVAYPDPNSAHFCAGGPCSLLAGAARSTGSEIDFYGEILPGWSVTANYANIDARFTKLDSGANPGIGERFYGVPRNQANLFTTYEFQNDSVLKGAKIGAGYHYVGSMPVADYYNPPWAWRLLPSYGTIDLMAGYSWSYAGSKMTAQVNVTNLLDRTYYNGFTNQSGYLAPGVLGAGAYRTYGAPFAVMGSLRAELDKGATPAPWLLPVATVAPSLPSFTWTGLYVGGQMGYGWGDNAGAVNWATAQGQLGPGAQGNKIDGDSQGVIGGAHIGYSQQFDQWVLGLEGSIDGTTLKRYVITPGPNLIADPASGGFQTYGVGGQMTGRMATGVQGSVRARAGYAFGRLLPYVTGGLAVGSFHTDAQLLGLDVDTTTQFAASGTKSSTRVGWTAGAGLEYAINNHWSTRAEWRYSDFGHLGISTDPSAVGAAFFLDRHLAQQQLQVGFSYKFGPPDPEPMQAPKIVKGPASAGDGLPKLGALTVSAPFVMNWTGFYAGLHIGYGWGLNDGSLTFATPGGLAGQSALNGNAVVLGGGSNYNGDAIGVIGGAHFGYDRQIGKLIVGVEGSVDPTMMSRRPVIDTTNPALVDPVTGGNDVGVSATGGIWSTIQGSARLRAGYAFDPMLVYGTAGVALGEFGSDFQLYGVDNGTFTPFYAADQRSSVRVGWTLGAGVEYAVNPHWTVRGEYRYTDFGHLGDAPAATSMGVVYTADRHLDQQQVQVGFSYRFNDGPLTVAAAPAGLPSLKGPAAPAPRPVAWTGFHAGLNIGGGWSINNNNSTNFLPYTDPAFPFGSSQALLGGGVSPNLVYLPGDNGYTNVTAGAAGGGQFGYDFQFDKTIVVGAEADIQGTRIASGHNGNYLTALGTPFVGGSLLLPLGGGAPVGNVGVPWLGTLRARAGGLLNPSLLLYGTGGFAYAGLDVAGLSTTGAGWTVGAGGEWLFAPNWSAKLEYLYINPTASVGNNISGGFAASGSSKLSPVINVVRGGVNYHFDWAAPAPVIAKY